MSIDISLWFSGEALNDCWHSALFDLVTGYEMSNQYLCPSLDRAAWIVKVLLTGDCFSKIFPFVFIRKDLVWKATF